MAGQPMTAAEARRIVTENGWQDSIRDAVDAAPPLPREAADLLKATGCPVGQATRGEAA